MTRVLVFDETILALEADFAATANKPLLAVCPAVGVDAPITVFSINTLHHKVKYVEHIFIFVIWTPM
jgi:hypothetical protein